MYIIFCKYIVLYIYIYILQKTHFVKNNIQKKKKRKKGNFITSSCKIVGVKK